MIDARLENRFIKLERRLEKLIEYLEQRGVRQWDPASGGFQESEPVLDSGWEAAIHQTSEGI
jgi:hypothetical protein